MGTRAEISREGGNRRNAPLQKIDRRKIYGKAHHSFRPALERFAEKCAFDPYTGCVMWIGGTTSGRGHSEPYGSFWDEGRRHFAHRWSASNIHGFDIDGLQVDHCCPCGPSTLCVEHVNPETSEINRLLQNTRPGRAFQDLDTKKYWVYVQIGLEPVPERQRIVTGEDYFRPPLWLRPFLPVGTYAEILELDDGVPF